MNEQKINDSVIYVVFYFLYSYLPGKHIYSKPHINNKKEWRQLF